MYFTDEVLIDLFRILTSANSPVSGNDIIYVYVFLIEAHNKRHAAVTYFPLDNFSASFATSKELQRVEGWVLVRNKRMATSWKMRDAMQYVIVSRSSQGVALHCTMILGTQYWMSLVTSRVMNTNDT